MDLEQQILVTASIMICCILASTSGQVETNVYSDQDRGIDLPYNSFWTLRNERNAHKLKSFQDTINDPNGDSIEEFEAVIGRPIADIPIRSLNDLESDDVDRNVVYQSDEELLNKVYSLLGKSGRVAIDDESAFNEPIIDDDRDRELNGELENMYEHEYLSNTIPKYRTGFGLRLKPYSKRMISESPIEQSFTESVYRIPSKRTFRFNSNWRSIFGHSRMRPTWRQEDNRSERKRYYGRRISYFDTLASRIIGK